MIFLLSDLKDCLKPRIICCIARYIELLVFLWRLTKYQYPIYCIYVELQFLINANFLNLTGPLVQYKQGDEEIPDLFDLAEMSKDEHEEEAAKISFDQTNKSKALDTPLPIQISADDLD